MRRTVLWVLTTASVDECCSRAAKWLRAGRRRVNGCVIEPSTSCASANAVRRGPRPAPTSREPRRSRAPTSGNQPERCEPHRGEPRRGADRRYRTSPAPTSRARTSRTQRSRAQTSEARRSAGRHAPTERWTTRAARLPPTTPTDDDRHDRRPRRSPRRPRSRRSTSVTCSVERLRPHPSPSRGRPRTRRLSRSPSTASTPAGFGPSGSTNVVVPCDDASHTITITPREATRAAGEPESEDVSAS